MKILATVTIIAVITMATLYMTAGTVESNEKTVVSKWTDKYDGCFKSAVADHWPPGMRNQWQLLKAQCITESHLRTGLTSSAGAEGICQILPSTFEEVERKVNLRQLGRRSPCRNIEAAAAYMNRLMRIWRGRPRSKSCLVENAWCCYNAGCGNCIKAQAIGGDGLCWDQIAPYLHQVTGVKHSAETLAYIQRTWRHWREVKGYELE